MQAQSPRVIDSAIRLGLIALLAAWCLQIAAPFISLITWAGIIAIGVYPLQLMLKDKTGFSSGRSALLITILMLAMMLGPTIILSGALLDNAKSLSAMLQQGRLEIPPPVAGVSDWPIIGDRLAAFWSKAHQDPQVAFGPFTPQLKVLAGKIVGLAAGLGLSILSFTFSVIIAGLFLASAQGAKQAVEAIFSRLVGQQRGQELTALSCATVKSVVTGILGIAVMQSALAGLGFVVMGIPAAGILAFVCLVMAIVQLDILLILIPLSIYAFSTVGTVPAIIFLVWNLLVGLSNNVLKPILLAKGVDVPMAIIFIGAIGGMMMSGVIGLFVGAVVMVLGYNLFAEWLRQSA